MLKQALAGMTAIPQWFVWRLVPDPAKPGKTLKVPVHPDGRVVYHEGRITGINAQDPANWVSFETAQLQLAQHIARFDGFGYTLGFMLTADCGYWFLDVDSCVRPDGTLTEWAQWFYQNLPGALFEYSSSGTGIHMIGRGAPPAGHRTRPTQVWLQQYPGNDLEFYSSGRGIAFGTNGQAWGNADTHLPGHAQWLVDNIFTPDASTGVALVTGGPRADWRGPADDAELLRRAMQSQSAGAMFSGKAGFADLWTCNIPVLAATYPDPDRSDGLPYGGTEADFALASHLAFWTGCDEERIYRLMLQSRLVRDKWSEHRTYLKELTIHQACLRTANVLQDKEVVQKLETLTTADAQVSRQAYADMILSCNEDMELRNEIVPRIAGDRSIDHLDRDFLAAVVKRRMGEWGFPVSISDCKAMLRYVAVEGDDGGVVPEWANRHVYVMNHDCFFDLSTATMISRTAFNARYDRMMPQKANGDREDAAKWCLQRWNTSTVDDYMYLPGQEPLFQYEGRWYSNLYSPASVPEIAIEYTPQGVEAIDAFQRHIKAFCGQRPEVYTNLFDWMAWVVQNPGKKCRWAPLLKGIQGDGKTLILEAVRAAMGAANVRSLNNKLLKSDFGDWQEGSCVAGIEELMMTGRQRYDVANSLKEPIANSSLTINRKGRTSGADIINVTNYIAFTNYVDAAPLEDSDRRWWVVFSPFTSKGAVANAQGLTVEGLFKMYETIFNSFKNHRAEWRKFLIDYQVSGNFYPNRDAPLTEEKNEMRISGEDVHEGIARQCIEHGSVGVGRSVLSSSCLTAAMRAVCLQDGIEPPKTTSVNHMLTRLGYSQVAMQVKWDGKPHRVWWKRGEVVNNSTAVLRSMLELTKIQHAAQVTG